MITLYSILDIVVVEDAGTATCCVVPSQAASLLLLRSLAMEPVYRQLELGVAARALDHHHAKACSSSSGGGRPLHLKRVLARRALDSHDGRRRDHR